MLYNIDLSVRGQELKCESVKMASDTVNEVRCHFAFEGDEWNVDVKTAIFSDVRGGRYVKVLNEDSCNVPSEPLAAKGPISVNVVGSVIDGDTLVERMTSYRTLIIENMQKVHTDGNNSAEPTPSEFEQFIAIVKEDAEAAEQAAIDAEGYKDSAQNSAESAQESAGLARQSAESAETSSESAGTSAAQAQESAGSAAGFATNANAAAVAAGKYAQTAQSSAANASISETNARSAETNAKTAQNLAEKARDDAIEANNIVVSLLSGVIRYTEEE